MQGRKSGVEAADKKTLWLLSKKILRGVWGALYLSIICATHPDAEGYRITTMTLSLSTHWLSAESFVSWGSRVSLTALRTAALWSS